MAPKSDGHAKTDGHGKVRWSAPKSDGLLEIGIPKPDGYTKVPRSVSYRHGTPKSDCRTCQSPKVRRLFTRHSTPKLHEQILRSMKSRHETVIVTSKKPNFNSRILRWIPSRRGIFFEKVRKTEEVESIFIYFFVGIG